MTNIKQELVNKLKQVRLKRASAKLFSPDSYHLNGQIAILVEILEEFSQKGIFKGTE